MGYRNSVAIRCQEKAAERMWEVIDKNDITPDKIIRLGTDTIFNWDWIKWYKGIEEFDCIEKVMESLDDDHQQGSDDGLGYSFARIGEDCDDNETRCNEYEIELCINRSFSFEDEETNQLSIDDITGTIGRWLSEDTSDIPLTIITSLMSVYGEAAGILASRALTEEMRKPA